MESKIEVSNKSFIDVKEIDYLKKEYDYHITLERFSGTIKKIIDEEKEKIDDNFLEKNLKNIIGQDDNKPTVFHYLCYYACCITITNIYNLFSDKSKFTSLLNRNDKKKMTPIIYVIIGHYASNTDEILINKRIELINFLCSIDIGIINKKTDNNQYIAIDYCFEGLLFNEKYLRYFEVNLNEDNLRKNTEGAIKMVTENFITSTQYMYKIFECLLSKYDVSEFTSFLSKFEKIYDSKNEYDNTVIIEGIKFDFKNCKIYNKVVDKLKELKKKAEEESEKNAQELEEEEAKKKRSKKKKKQKGGGMK